MNLGSNSDDELSGIFRHIWVWLPIAVVLLLLLSSLINSKNAAKNVGFEALTQSFAQSINLIHARWVQQNKPQNIQWELHPFPSPTHSLVAELQGSYSTVSLNENGWPIVNDSKLSLPQRCEQIRLNILPAPLLLDNKIIFSLELIKKGHWIGCNYRLSELSFNYWLDSGRIEVSP